MQQSPMSMAVPACLLLLVVLSSVLMTSLALVDPVLDPELFYPFGRDVGDSVMEPNDDGSSGSISISTGFPFFATNNTILFVNTNGGISFGKSVSSYTPVPFPTEHRLIAPYWCDVDTRNRGRIYYRQSTDEGLLNRATTDVRKIFSRGGLYSFKAKWVFIATWHNVTYYGGSAITPINSFQLVLITDGRHSIAMFNYGRLTWTTGTSNGGNANTGLGGTPAQAGFDAGDRLNFFAVPGSRQPTILQISNNTNAYKNGRWMFRVENAHIETSSSCIQEGRCEAHQKFDDITQTCKDHFPAFSCPRIEGPNVVDRWVEFYCEIPTAETSKSAVYEVTFLFNGERSNKVRPIRVSHPERKATLYERHLFKLLGTWISCKVLSYWENNVDRSQELTSVNRYFAGIEISPQMLSVHEGDIKPAIVTFKSTIPITCHDERDEECDLVLRFKTSKNIVLLSTEDSNCHRRISRTDWKVEERKAYRHGQGIELYAMVDPIASSPRLNELTIEIDAPPKKRDVNGEEYTNMWKGYTAQEIHVYHNDGPHAVCRATGDPNLTTFDRVFYSVYASGQFTYVRTTNGPLIEIQVRHKPCGQVVSCACGVAAREGDVILIADKCTDRYVSTVTPNDPKKLPKGVGIRQDETGRSVQIRLLSGVKVMAYVTSWGMNIEIYLTPAEFNRTKGLCGTFDHDPSNDLWAKGQTRPLTPKDLTTVVESWRVPDGKSLFEGHVTGTGNEAWPSKNRSFCSCGGGAVGNCGSMNFNNSLDGQNSINDRHKRNTLQQTGETMTNQIQLQRRKRSVDSGSARPLPDAVDWNYNGSAFYAAVPKTFGNISRENRSGLTEAEAEAHCRKVLWDELPVRSRCEGKVNESDVSGIINKCVLDIRMTDDMSWANDKISEVESLCMFEIITANITEIGIPIENLTEAVSEISDHVCLPPDCSGHGLCRQGKCVCHSGYIGSDCAVDEAAVPRITKLLSKPSCDVNRFLCENVEFLTEDVAALNTLTCKVEVEEMHKSFETTGYLKSLSVASCELPTERFQTGLRALQKSSQSNDSGGYELGFYSLPPGNPALMYSVSISSIGRRFSEPKRLAVCQSKCFEFDGTSCVKKNDTCLINGYCFEKDERNPFNPECDICEPTFSSDTWKKQSDPLCDPCKSNPCSGRASCISPFKGHHHCIGSNSLGFLIIAVGLSVASVILLVFAVIIVIHCRNKKKL